MHAKLLSGGQDDATHNRLGTAGMQGTGGTGRPGCDARGRRRGPDKSRMQFKNTSDVTLQTDTNQHDTRGELHAKLRNDGHLSANHAPPAWRASEDRRRGRGAGGRRQGLAGQRVDAPSEARSADGSRAGRRPRARQAARPAKQREAARPHWDQAACTSGDSCQKSQLSQHSTSRRRGRPRR